MKQIQIIYLSVLVSFTYAWWPFGDDSEPDVEEVEQLSAILNQVGDQLLGGMDEGGKDIVKHIVKAGLKMKNEIDWDSVQENIKEYIPSDEPAEAEEVVVKDDNLIPDEKTINGTPELANHLDQQAFEEKLEEVIKAHEDIHTNKEPHFDEEGEHNHEFDHKAFLGDEAEVFKDLAPEESKDRLGKIVDLIDKDNDTFISEEELTNWIKETAIKSVSKRTEEFWGSSNPEGKEELSWDEYRAIQYGFLTDGHIADAEGRWVDEDDVDPETLEIYRQLEQRDRRRWTVADRNKNLQLSKSEFSGFLHPESEDHMSDILASETMADFDKDGDGKLNLTEYVQNVFGDTKSVADWDNGGIQFRTFRDLNKDGFIDKEELKVWLQPTDYDQDQAEAAHLIWEADKDADSRLTKEEVVNSYTLFVSSKATDFGADLHTQRDEL